MLIPAERYFGIEGREWEVYPGIIDKGLERGLRWNIFFVATNHYSKQDKKTPPKKEKKISHQRGNLRSCRCKIKK